MNTRDPGFARILELAGRAARSDANVLLTGESGTGKSRLARWIHEHGPRADRPLVEVPCANLPAELVESELFGHERGAFTDAHEARDGRLLRADGGTLFLDEVQDLPVDVQAKVLRVLQERRLDPLGSSRSIEIDVRIVASAGVDPERAVAEGRLREDLLYRLDVVRLDLPPLRSRAVDVPELAREFLGDAVRRHRLGDRSFAAETLDRLARHPWPGNLRELAHAVESAAVLADGAVIGPHDLPASLSVASDAGLRGAAAAGLSLRDLEHAYIQEVLHRTSGNKSAAARILGISRKTLHQRLRDRKDA
jgi:two-component system response regulator HydG